MNANADTAARVTVMFVEDCEGDGTCLACGREGLRWILVLSDGSRVGSECAKAILGSYTWINDYTALGYTVNPQGECVRVWKHKRANAFALTVDGVMRLSGDSEFVAAAFKRYAA
jgi:hypothetical protein